MKRHTYSGCFSLEVQPLDDNGKVLSICFYGSTKDPSSMKVVDVQAWIVPSKEEIYNWFDYTTTEQPWRIQH